MNLKISEKNGVVVHRMYKLHPVTGETIPLEKYEVFGGFVAATTNLTLKGALKLQAERVAFNKKYPWTPPRSERELAKARRLGLL